MILAPLPEGMLTVTQVGLYPTRDRVGAPTNVAAQVTAGWVGITPPANLVGRYWARFTDGATNVDLADPVDLPDDPSLVVSPEYLATRAKITLPLTEPQRDTITEAIRDAQADVVAYLGRPITPTTYTETGLYPWGDTWDLTLHGDDPVLRILNAAPVLVDGVPTGYFDVTYVAGIDAKHDPELRPIRRFVTAHALNSPEVTDLWKAATGAKGDIRSVSVTGQSVSWSPATLGGGGAPGSGVPGALPTLASLDRWREAGRRVYQGRSRVSVWPYYPASNRDWFER